MKRDIKVVAIGGGHGLPVVLKSIQKYSSEITAIATVADDGGSSGILRDEFGMPPPGDSRNCLVALSNGNIYSQLFQYRFDKVDGLKGHALGNLIIAALTDITGDFEEALLRAKEMLGAVGRVIPPTKEDVTLCAGLEPVGEVCGQCNVANRLRPLKSIWLDPPDPKANPEAVKAIIDADQIILGPGSLFTSLLPNLLVKGICDAIVESTAQTIFICNIVVQPGETDGFTTREHLEAIERHTGQKIVDIMIANQMNLDFTSLDKLAESKSPPISISGDFGDDLVTQVVADVVNYDSLSRHDADKLGDILIKIINNELVSIE